MTGHGPGRRGVFGLAALVVALAGCSGMLLPPRATHSATFQVSDSAAEKSYQSALERWTRRAEIYDGLDSRAFVAATLQSMAFREARLARTVAFRALPPSDAEALLDTERKEHQETLELLLGIHVNERRFDDLAQPSSQWRLALVTSAGETPPVSVERMPRPDLNLTGLYPYLEPFWTAYRVRFPRTFANGAQVLPRQQQPLVVRLASAAGRVELRWELEVPATAAWP